MKIVYFCNSPFSARYSLRTHALTHYRHSWVTPQEAHITLTECSISDGGSAYYKVWNLLDQSAKGEAREAMEEAAFDTRSEAGVEGGKTSSKRRFFDDNCWRMLTYAEVVYWRVLTYAEGVCWRVLTYADVCWGRVLTYADVCWGRVLTSADVCWCVSHHTTTLQYSIQRQPNTKRKFVDR